jgi:hypothetical protein
LSHLPDMKHPAITHSSSSHNASPSLLQGLHEHNVYANISWI